MINFILLLFCVVFSPYSIALAQPSYYISLVITNYPTADPCNCMEYSDIVGVRKCVTNELMLELCRGQNLSHILGYLNEALNRSSNQETSVYHLKLTLDDDEYTNTIIFDQKALPLSLKIEKVTIAFRKFTDQPVHLCPDKGNGITAGVLSFVDWVPKTEIYVSKYAGCRNDEESIITIRNSSYIFMSGLEFSNNAQSSILIIDSNVNISNCTIRNNVQYYNKTIKQSVISGVRNSEIAFSLGITIIMTESATETHTVNIDNVHFIDNRCLKSYRLNETCVHDVDKNAIPTSYFGGAVGAAFNSNSGKIYIRDSVFINNTACDSGGGIFIHVCDGMNDGRFEIVNSSFNKNTAGFFGGGIYLMQEIEAHNFVLILNNSVVDSNQGCIAGGGLAVLIADQSHKFNLIKHLTNVTRERVSFSYVWKTKIKRNFSGRISSGHAAYLKAYNSPAKRQHPVMVFTDCEISANYKLNNTPNGLTFGSILAENFILVFTGNNNISNSEAGGLLLIQSLAILYGNLSFYNLCAYSGGAIHARKWSKVLLTKDSDVLFYNNSASIAGGAIFHYFGNWNGYSTSNVYNSYCILGYFPSIRTQPEDWESRIRFIGNDAGAGGGAVFVTDLRECGLVGGKLQLDKALNYTDKFVYINNTVSQGRLTYIGNPYTYGTIAGPVEKLRKLHEDSFYEKGPGIDRPLNYEPLDQLNQTTIAVIKFEPTNNNIKITDDYQVITPKNINRYMKCKDSGSQNCLKTMPYIYYSVTDMKIPETIIFDYEIESGIESINVADNYYQNDKVIIRNPYCDVGYSMSTQGICTCDYHNQENGIVRCTSTGEVFIEPGYWGIKRQENNSDFTLSGIIVKCAHSTCACNRVDHSHDASYCQIPDNPNNLCVEELHREGDLCGQCKENFTFLPFSVECVQSPDANYSILMAVYVLMTFVSACLIVIFRCKLWNGFRIFIIILYSLTYINYSFNFISHITILRFIQILQGFTILNFYLIYPAYKDKDFTTTEILALYPVVTILIVLAIFGVLSVISYRFPASSFHHKFKFRRLLSPGIYLWYIMSLSLFRVFLDFAYCIHIDNSRTTQARQWEYRNRYSGATLCYTMEYGYVYYLASMFFLVLFLILPVPVLLIIGSLKQSINRSYSLNKLILPFRPWGRFHWGWEFIRFLLLATGLVVHDTAPKTGNSVLSMFIVFLMIVHITFWPYKERSANIIECIGWILLALVFIIDNGVTLEYSYLDVFQLILISLIIILLICAFVVYIILKIVSKLAKARVRRKLMKVLPKNMPKVKGLSEKIYKQLSENIEEEKSEEPKDTEKTKQKTSDSVHRRDSILTKLSIAVNKEM